MDLIQLLGSSFECTCGRQHTVPIEEFFYDQYSFGSIPRLINRFSDGNRCMLIADSRTYMVAGEEIRELLADDDFTAQRFIVPDIDGESPVVDSQTKDSLLEECSAADLYIALGSGVINDLVKWLAFLQHKPYIVVATAASMNGYASANVAATVDGLKVLFHAAAPKAVIATPDILINAPHELSTAGLGDVLAKSVSGADWRVNQFLFGDYYCQFSVDLLKHLEPIYLKNPQKIRDRDPAGFKALFEALFYSSVAMTITGTSAPASGGEHLISHTLDMLAARDNHAHDLHGRQVGVSSILMAALYERLMTIEEPQFKDPPTHVDESFWGSLTPVIEKEFQEKLPRMSEAAAILKIPANWRAIKETIRPNLIPAQNLKECLREAMAAHRYSDLQYNKSPLDMDFFMEIVNHAHQMRNRFTVLDIATIFGVIPDETEALIEKWLS